jgi:hypothetical protein
MINVAQKSDGVMSNNVWWHTVVYLNYQALNADHRIVHSSYVIKKKMGYIQ